MFIKKIIWRFSVLKIKFLSLYFLLWYKLQISSVDYILLDTPMHGNLGDQAIVLAERQLLDKSGCKYLEIPGVYTDGFEKLFAKITPMYKVILIQGGGFLGDLWPNEEYRFRRILKAFNKNKIIVFPQTVTFSLDTDEKKKFFEESKMIYTENKNLIICVREQKSYDFIKKYLSKVNVLLMPDIVTQFEINNFSFVRRNGILLCLRSDKEKNISQKFSSKIVDALKLKFPNEALINTDTVVANTVMPNERSKFVMDKLKEFSSSKLVITDRLHGMIFAALTNTPCIALGNINGKVKGVYEWIKANDYIKYVENYDEFEMVLDSLDLKNNYRYDYFFINKRFYKLKDILNLNKG